MILNLAFGPNRRLSGRETVSVGEHSPQFLIAAVTSRDVSCFLINKAYSFGRERQANPRAG